MAIKILSLCFLVAVTPAFIACSSSDATAEKPRTTSERTSGYQSADKTWVGPRGKASPEGVPLEVGAYGKRKKISGDLTIDKSGETLQNIDVEGTIFVNADNITISNFRATQVTQDPTKKGMSLKDGTIDGQNKGGDGIQWSNFTAIRMNISRSFDGIKAQGNVTIRDSFIHDMYAWKGSGAGAGDYTHNDCVQISAGKNILIERNWMDNCGNNSAIFIDPDQGPIENVTVQHNYLNSGGITLYAIASRSADNGVPQRVTISNNVFGESHLYDYASIGEGVTFVDNLTTSGDVITPRFDDDES